MMYCKKLTQPLCGVLLATALWGGMPAAQAANAPAVQEAAAVDLILDRPNYLEVAWAITAKTVGWVWGLLYDNVLDYVTPPSPTSITGGVDKKDAAALFSLMKDAGYKLKEIDTQVGIIPTIAFKFGIIRELSEADYDYLEEKLDSWYRQNAGPKVAIQRAILDTVIAVNLSGDYQVTTVKVQLLPLPKVAFSMGPKETALGEEGSALMGAIQRVGRTVQDLRRDQKK